MKKALAILGILISTTTMGMDDNTKREHIAIIQEKYPTNEGVALAYYSLQDKITRILFWHTRGISLHRACIVDGKFNRCASDDPFVYSEYGRIIDQYEYETFRKDFEQREKEGKYIKLALDNE